MENLSDGKAITGLGAFVGGAAGRALPPPASPCHRRPALSFTSTGDATMDSQEAGLALANVLYAIKGSIAYVTVNRPKVLNALNTPTWSDLRKAFKDARDDAAVRGVILTGAGDKAFIAGADISELTHLSGFEAEQSSRFGQEVLDLIENLGKPVVAAVNGFALGGGCETAMACSIRIAVEGARVCQPEVAL